MVTTSSRSDSVRAAPVMRALPEEALREFPRPATFDRAFILAFFSFFPLLRARFLLSTRRKGQREIGIDTPWTSTHLPSSLSSFGPFPFFSFSPSFSLSMLRQCRRGKTDCRDTSSTRRSLMGSAVSTGFQSSLTTRLLPRDCGLSRTP